ncbi:MAG: hypothetical protein NXH85_13570 [Pseudomonadaceae bacterium]|nr:hypothetical protein [Pseudomonadaceae bacterium]
MAKKDVSSFETLVGALILGAAVWWFFDSPDEVVMYSLTTTNVRDAPSLSGHVVRQLPIGSAVTVDLDELSGQLEWFEMNSGEFVATSVLSTSKPSQKTEAHGEFEHPESSTTGSDTNVLAKPPSGSPEVPDYVVEHFGTMYLVSKKHVQDSIWEVVTLAVFPEGRFPASTVFTKQHVDCRKREMKTIGEGHGLQPASIEPWKRENQQWRTLVEGSTTSNVARFACSISGEVSYQ